MHYAAVNGILDKVTTIKGFCICNSLTFFNTLKIDPFTIKL